ncbi:IS66 family insertion sequence element accessory protein TnpB [Clostridium perfringens]|uniref:IS66 family insertion sequence element accessory protein TnpB n=1 Tax=Clostridium perfringens TaxID=1502 RepID=UPI003C6C3D9F
MNTSFLKLNIILLSSTYRVHYFILTPGFWLLYKRFENGQLTWPRNTTEVQALTPEQVEWLMKGFSITPKILESQSRHFY